MSRRKYRAFVIDGRKVIKNTVSGIIGIVLAAAIITGVKLSGVKLDLPSYDKKDKPSFAFIEDWFDPLNIIGGEVSILKYINVETQTVFNEKNAGTKTSIPKSGIVVGLSGELPIKEIDSSQNKAIGTDKILVKNETSYSVNTGELLNERIGIDMSKTGPKVLIVHTHGSESYTEEGKEFYIEGTGDRNTDTQFNVVYVGDKMTEVFEKSGIEVIHDRTMHDQPSYNGSYQSSLESIEKYTEEYPSIQVVFDIHRDAIVYQDGTKAKVVTEIDGKSTAQLMFVVGTNEGGLVHDNWRESCKMP